MKLSEAIQYINSALNYPAISYEDISLYFDMAIAELNTTLHTSIPTVNAMAEDFRRKMSKSNDNTVILSGDPTNPLIGNEIPNEDDYEEDPTIPYYYNGEEQVFYIIDKYTHQATSYPIIRGIYSNGTSIRLFESFNMGNSAIWVEVPGNPDFECQLDDYLPDDWVLLWLIPYVCFKYTVRDGGTAQTFAEELTQGFQQLQETYDVPSKVILSKYADKPAYTSLVEKYLPNLNVSIPTKAIYENMKHSRNTNAIFGSFYDRGGF